MAAGVVRCAGTHVLSIIRAIEIDLRVALPILPSAKVSQSGSIASKLGKKRQKVSISVWVRPNNCYLELLSTAFWHFYQSFNLLLWGFVLDFSVEACRRIAGSYIAELLSIACNLCVDSSCSDVIIIYWLVIFSEFMFIFSTVFFEALHSEWIFPPIKPIGINVVVKLGSVFVQIPLLKNFVTRHWNWSINELDKWNMT